MRNKAFSLGKTDVRAFVGSHCVRHDRSVPGGAGGRVERFQDLEAKAPGAAVTVKRTAADHDLVAVHRHASAIPADEATSGLSTIDGASSAADTVTHEVFAAAARS